MKIAKSYLRRLIKEVIQEDWRDDSSYTISKAKTGEEPGYMGVDPEDIKDQILDQFSITGQSIVELIKQIRIMKELASEMSNMEAEGYIEGDFGTKTWHEIRAVDSIVRGMVKDWNKIGSIQ